MLEKVPLLVQLSVLPFPPEAGDCPKAICDFVRGHTDQAVFHRLHLGGGAEGRLALLVVILFAGDLQGHAGTGGHFHLRGSGGGIENIPGEGSRGDGEQDGGYRQGGQCQSAFQLFGRVQHPAPFG